MRSLFLMLASGCVVSAPPTTGDTGAAGCASFVPPAFVPGTCAGGGASDLVADLRPQDATGVPCSVCAAGDLGVDVVAVNPCPYDLQLPSAWLVDYRHLSSPALPFGSQSTAMSWTSPTNPIPVTVPANGEASLGLQTFYHLDPGTYEITIGFQSVLADATTSACLQ